MLRAFSVTQSLTYSKSLYPPSDQKCPLPSPELLWETLGMGVGVMEEQRNIYSFLPPEKSLLINLHPPLSKVSFLPHQIAMFM